MSPKVVDDATRDARENELMRSALAIIATEGVSGLTIDKLVAQVPYSKGTVYNHFSCKEDLLTALCNSSVRNLTLMFRRAASFDGNSRERMLAIGFAYMLHSQLNPTEFMLVISAKTPSVSEKSSAERQDEHLVLENELMDSIMQIITSGLSSGELVLQPHLSPPQVAFALWAMCFGTIALLHESLERCNVRTEMQLENELINHCNLVLDGLNWKPFTQTQDWINTLQQLKEGTFAAEIAELKQLMRDSGESHA